MSDIVITDQHRDETIGWLVGGLDRAEIRREAERAEDAGHPEIAQHLRSWERLAHDRGPARPPAEGTSFYVTDANGSTYLATLWGSDCLDCGDATAGSQRCREALPNEDHETVALWTLATQPRPTDPGEAGNAADRALSAYKAGLNAGGEP